MNRSRRKNIFDLLEEFQKVIQQFVDSIRDAISDYISGIIYNIAFGTFYSIVPKIIHSSYCVFLFRSILVCLYLYITYTNGINITDKFKKGIVYGLFFILFSIIFQ